MAHHKIWFASTASLIVEIFNNLLYKISVRLVAFNLSVEKAFQSKNKLKDDSQLDDAIDLLPDNKASSEEKQILKGIRNNVGFKRNAFFLQRTLITKRRCRFANDGSKIH